MTIKELREQTGLTQKEFAKQYHLTRGQVESWEQGWRNTPPCILYMLGRLVPMDCLLKSENKMSEEERDAGM